MEQRDEIILNKKFDSYIEEINANGFYARIKQILSTIKINYCGGLLLAWFDINFYEFNKGEEFVVYSKLSNQIDLVKWNYIIKEESEKLSKDINKSNLKFRKIFNYPKNESVYNYIIFFIHPYI